eukprot:TRINITY_DN48940_c0_g1_i1.p1 TRINITY_DN48940_c0_g1~~TRINITY_DN48940_c0_g1_i1.p1  ORF type:complete len:437 (+),score=52.96 TRINITY_DN48940_c0_g1_i1:108-1418(+)
MSSVVSRLRQTAASAAQAVVSRPAIPAISCHPPMYSPQRISVADQHPSHRIIKASLGAAGADVLPRPRFSRVSPSALAAALPTAITRLANPVVGLLGSASADRSQLSRSPLHYHRVPPHIRHLSPILTADVLEHPISPMNSGTSSPGVPPIAVIPWRMSLSPLSRIGRKTLGTWLVGTLRLQAQFTYHRGFCADVSEKAIAARYLALAHAFVADDLPRVQDYVTPPLMGVLQQERSQRSALQRQITAHDQSVLEKFVVHDDAVGGVRGGVGAEGPAADATEVGRSPSSSGWTGPLVAVPSLASGRVRVQIIGVMTQWGMTANTGYRRQGAYFVTRVTSEWCIPQPEGARVAAEESGPNSSDASRGEGATDAEGAGNPADDASGPDKQLSLRNDAWPRQHAVDFVVWRLDQKPQAPPFFQIVGFMNPLEAHVRVGLF